jgi:hypothetical protein
MTWVDVAKEAGVSAARSTIERLFHSHDLFRYQTRLKPPLTDEIMKSRVELAKLALTIDIRRIVFTDEMWVEFNSSRRQTHQTRKKGENPYDVAEPRKEDEATIRVMFWSAINILTGAGPGYIYPKATKEDNKHQQAVQKEVNAEREERTKKRIALAEIPGTKESQQVIEFNRNIDQQNLDEGRTGRHKKHHRKPAQIFHTPEIKVQTKGGINWVSYREQVLHPLLYPWIRNVLQPQLLSETGDNTVWLVEDNAPAHQAAQKVDEDEREKLHIRTFNWPARSPDLNQIEQCWNYEKVWQTIHTSPRLPIL